jgi:hypothetical protein
MIFNYDTYYGVLDLSEERHAPTGDEWFYESDGSYLRAIDESRKRMITSVAAQLSLVTDAADLGLFDESAIEYVAKVLPGGPAIRSILGQYETEAGACFDMNVANGGSVVPVGVEVMK